MYIFVLLFFLIIDNSSFGQYRNDILFENDTEAPIIVAPDENDAFFEEIITPKKTNIVIDNINKNKLIESTEANYSLKNILEKEIDRAIETKPKDLINNSTIIPLENTATSKRINTVKFLNNNILDTISTATSQEDIRYFGGYENLKVYNTENNNNYISTGYFAMDKAIDFSNNYRIGGSIGVASMDFKNSNNFKEDGHLYLGSLYGLYSKRDLIFLSSINLGKDSLENKYNEKISSGSLYGFNNEIRKKYYEGNYYLGPRARFNMNLLKEENENNLDSSYTSFEGSIGFFAGQNSLKLINSNLGWEVGTNLYSEFGDPENSTYSQANYGDIGFKLFGNIYSVGVYGEYKQILTETNSDWVSSAGIKYIF
ncbi:autotransporter outer membrane beta-barrel domain-containing protein [Cetobacterium ceti]